MSSSQCSVCKSTAQLSSGSPGPCICPSDSYPNPTSKHCSVCHALCLTCSGGSELQCKSCRAHAHLKSTVQKKCECDIGYFPQPDANTCVPCHSTCRSCLGSTEEDCESCPTHATLDTGNQCWCDNGYFWDGTSKSCVTCVSSCFKCTGPSAGDCTQCPKHSSLSGPAPSACVCDTGFYFSAPVCSPCDSSCLACSGAEQSHCVACKANAVLIVSGTTRRCVCAAGYYASPTAANCLSCASPCSLCIDGDSSKCILCKSKAAGLPPAGCKPSTTYLPFPASQCDPCPPTCARCNSPTVCVSCPPGRQLNSPNCDCAAGFYAVGSDCLPCDETCLSCTAAGPSGCSACSPPALLGTNACECPVGAVPSNCVVCHPTCASCTGVGPAYCTACKSNAHLDSYAGVTGQVCICNSRYYPSPDASNCKACSFQCAECMGQTSSDCLSCSFGYVLKGGLVPGVCDPVQLFDVFTSSSVCGTCHSTCLKCFGPEASKCTACFPHASVSAGECVCDEGHFASSTSQLCQPCHSSCKGCTGWLSTQCSSCFSNAGLDGTSCVCDAQYFPDPTASHCSACDPSCLTCEDTHSRSCLSCHANAALDSSARVGACVCITAFYADSTACKACHGDCQECVGGGASDCTKCSANASLQGSTCVCDEGYMSLTDASHCVACHASCSRCSAPGSSTACTACYPFAEVKADACVCLSGYYPNVLSSYCSPCDPAWQCATCTGPQECSTCPPGAGKRSTLFYTTCTCSLGQFFNRAKRTCEQCSVTCKSCETTADTCISCYQYAVLTPLNTCECCPGCFTLTTAAKCTSCHRCRTCSHPLTASDSTCTGCYTNAKLTASAPFRCICVDGYFYPAAASTTCMQCPALCAQCLSAQLCTTCLLNAVLVGSEGTGYCECVEGFYLLGAACQPCHETCWRCGGPTDRDCTECKSLAKLDESGKCRCEENAFPAPTAAHCTACSATCRGCQSASPSTCLACTAHALLQGRAPSLCECASGYFPAPDASNCQRCPQHCLECEESGCTLCHPNAKLTLFSCACESGFYQDSTSYLCVKCPRGCSSCEVTACFACDLRWFLHELTCVEECPYGFTANRVQWVCEVADLSPLTASLTADANNTLHLVFSKPMNNSISDSDVSISIEAPDDLEVNALWSNSQFISPYEATISLKLDAEYLESDSTAILTFQRSVSDIYGIQLNATSLSCGLTPYGSAPASNLLATSSAATAAAMSKGALSGSAVSSLATGSAGGLTALITNLQLLSYLAMTKLTIPPQFAGSLAGMNVESLVPNPLSAYLSPKIEKLRPEQNVQNYGLETALFLENSLGIAVSALGVLASFLPIWVLSKAKSPVLSAYFKKMLPALQWTVPLQIWTAAYLDIAVFSLLQQALPAPASSLIEWISLVFSVLFASAVILTPVLLLVFLYRYYRLITSRADSVFSRHWEFLFSAYKTEGAVSGFAFYPLFIVRRLLLALSVTFAANQVETVALANSLTAGAVPATQACVYTLACRPYVGTLDQWEASCTEVIVSLVYAVAAVCHFSSALRGVLDVVGMWLVRLALFVNCSFSALRTCIVVAEVVREYRAKTAGRQHLYRLRNKEAV